MTVSIIKLSPGTTPEHFSHTTQQPLPDGVGLQIFFEVDGEYYLIAGPRAGGRVTAVNGGKIENIAHTFYAQISEELYEETFGFLRLETGDDGCVLVINNHERYPLRMLEEQTAFEQNSAFHYNYVTFTAVCSGLSREQLDHIAGILSPTAKFWNQIGNYLHQQCKKAPCHVCGDFKKFWNLDVKERQDLISVWVDDYYQLIRESALLADPCEIFDRNTVEAALATLHDIDSIDKLGEVFHHVVGNYSERSGYHVFKARDLMTAAQSGSQQIKDANGVLVASGIYYADVVATLFPHILPKPPVLQCLPSLKNASLWPVKKEIVSTEITDSPAFVVSKHH